MGTLESIVEFKECIKLIMNLEKSIWSPDATTNDFAFWDY
jgi:hypothetical protein